MNPKVVTSHTQPMAEGAPAKVVNVPLVERSGRYRVGEPIRPDIKHDNGFLGQFAPEEPIVSDRLQLAYWRAKLESAEALRSGLADATAAYRHFLGASGSDRVFNYERYVSDDTSGAKTLQSLLNDFKEHAGIIGQNRESFHLTSEPYAIGGDAAFFPYPATENWQKAIGAHVAWASATVIVSTDKKDFKDIFEAQVTIHVEDRYNFNPGANDIATGIPDSANGRFEITGLGKQYMNYATITRSLQWKEGERWAVPGGGAIAGRQRKPADNRRLRNRV